MLKKNTDPFAAAEPVGVLIAAARRAINQTACAELRGSGLTPQQFWVLMALHEHPGLALREVCERRRMDPPTASRIVSALAAKGLVHIGGDVADRRRCRLDLTPSGHALALELRGLLYRLRELVVRGLSPAEQDTLRQLLRRVIDNVAPAGETGTEAVLAPSQLLER
jgi:DNA-binding MarR family transcriptional regulator